jgi:eukaryotic-like serine/threonine-protein kinase
MPAHAAMAPGATVGGKYRLARRIGAGGMGEVWAATNRTTGAEVAVKMVRDSAAREDASARFRHEARLGAMLSHRSVVRIFDLVEEADGGPLVLVMELLHGETLERHLRRRGPLPAKEALAIVVPVLAALGHAHETGIVHRDVTPANVFLAIDPDGHVTPKLLDFGIAKLPSGGAKHTIDGRALGTPRYMAPERIRDLEAIDGRSDLFSVGVVLYELLTGVCPFASSSPAASLAAVLEVVVDPDPRIDPRLWIELRRSLSKHPYERQATAAAMASGLIAACGETVASLSEILRQAPVARETSSADAALAEPPLTMAGHGGSAPRLARKGVAVALLAATLVVSATLAALAGAFRGEPVVRSPSSPSPATDIPSAPSVSAPPREATSAMAPLPPPVLPAATTAPARKPAHLPHPRPVATTPGF